MRPRNRDEFQIAIICALPLEANAVKAVFDEHYDALGESYGKRPGDGNTYSTGRIGRHNVVLVHMPGMGNSSSAAAAVGLQMSFVEIKLALLVGICGGVPFPSQNTDVILGDVIISDSIINYDFGRRYPDGFHRKNDAKETLGRPNRDVRSFLAGLRTHQIQMQEEISHHLQRLGELDDKWSYPGTANDTLFEASYRHKHYKQTQCICVDCNSSTDPVCEEALNSDCRKLGCRGKSLQRTRLSVDSPRPFVHIGAIASANTVMKSGEDRDELAKKEGVIGFEMEGAGVWDNVSCVIVKGVCDYADSHKNKIWQNYAAATAASCTKVSLKCWTSTSSTHDEGSYRHSGLGPAEDVVCWTVPFIRNKDFVGRELQLNEMEARLFGPDKSSKMALFALGGMGKSSLALEFACRIQDKYPTCSVFWVTSTNEETFEQSYQAIGSKLSLQSLVNNNMDIKKLVKDHLSDEKAGQYLMIYDNADDLNTWFEKPKSGHSLRLADYVPSSSKGCALLTTRDRHVAVKFANRSISEVTNMDMDTCVELLRNTLIDKDKSR